MNKAHNRPKKYLKAMIFNGIRDKWVLFEKPLTLLEARSFLMKRYHTNFERLR